MKLGNNLREKIKQLLLDDIFNDLCSPFKKDIKIFRNRKLNKTIDKAIDMAREIYTQN